MAGETPGERGGVSATGTEKGRGAIHEEPPPDFVLRSVPEERLADAARRWGPDVRLRRLARDHGRVHGVKGETGGRGL